MFNTLAACGLALIAFTPQLSMAQSPVPKAPASAAAALTGPAATTAPNFVSALEGYRPYTEEAPVDWKAANDTTARIGGWRAYAKEARQPETPQADDKTRAAPAVP